MENRAKEISLMVLLSLMIGIKAFCGTNSGNEKHEKYDYVEIARLSKSSLYIITFLDKKGNMIERDTAITYLDENRRPSMQLCIPEKSEEDCNINLYVYSDKVFRWRKFVYYKIK